MQKGVAKVPITAIRNLRFRLYYNQYVVCVEKTTYYSMANHAIVIDISCLEKVFTRDLTLEL